MTTGSLLLALALLLVVLLFVLRPFLLPATPVAPLSERALLEAEKDALLAQIQALDFDMETGKQTENDHAAEREALVGRAADILRRLDDVEDVDAKIEAAVQRLIALELESGADK